VRSLAQRSWLAWHPFSDRGKHGPAPQCSPADVRVFPHSTLKPQPLTVMRGSMGMSVGPLGGYSILVVDDEPLIAIGLNDALRDAGAEVLTAHDLTTALEAAVNSSVSAAILDVQLGASDCGAVCAALTSQEVPFMFLTGFDSHDVLKEWASIPTLAKPTGEAELVARVEALLKPPEISEAPSEDVASSD
jgi:response regulator RpfG family c-di-GMP phosphodiesterase